MTFTVLSVVSISEIWCPAATCIDNSCFTEKEIDIVHDLAQKIQRYEDVLVEASDICGEIDRQVTSKIQERMY